jgi:hypothetical protein
MFGSFGRKTWDIYDDVIGIWRKRIFSIGGDQDLGGGKAKKANRLVVIYMGPFKLEKDKRNHQVKLPKYIGSVKQ